MEKIYNIKYYTKDNQQIFVYSTKFDDLGYEYYKLTINTNGEIEHLKITNTIEYLELLKPNQTNLQEIPQNENNKQYLRFLQYYSRLKEKQKKGKKH